MQYLGNIENSLDSVNKEYVDKKHILASKTFAGVYLNHTSYPYWMMMRFIPKDNIGMWHIKYRMNVYTATASSTTRGKFIVEFFGYNRSVSASKIWNSFRDRPFYYNSLFIANSDANLLKYGIFAGVYFDNSNNATNTAYARTFEIDLLEAEGVDFSWLSDATRYNVATTMPVNGVDTSVTISSIAGASNYNGSSNGLQETGDSDSYYLGYISGGRYQLHPELRMSRYTLCGFDANGKLMQFSWYTNGTTTYSNGVAKKSSGIRTYNNKGFLVSRGIFYSGSSSETAAGATAGMSLFYYYSAPDFRYTDNCVASTTANSLGLVYNKPIYLRGTIGTDGLFYLAPIDVEYGSEADKTYQRVWTQDIPTTDDGYVYWLVGYPYYNSTYLNSGYQIALSLDNGLYAYKNGLFKEYEPYIRLTEKALLFSDLSSNTTNPISITIGGTTKSIAQSTLRASLGLKSAAYTESSAYATSAQGTKADNALPSASFTASNIVSTLGTTAVNRATADASGNNIVNTYATKTQLTNGSVTKVGTSTVGSTIRPIYLNGGTPTAVSSVGEAFLSWGGQNINGGISPIDAACTDEFGHNKLAFLPADCITVEYTTDGGATWLDYGASNAQKVAALTTSGNGFMIGKGLAKSTDGTLTNDNCTNYQVRVTISTRDSNGSRKLYTQAKKIIINYTSNGASGGKAKIETQTIGNYNNNVDTWSKLGEYDISGCSGWNSIPFAQTFGGDTSQTSQLAKMRITISISGVSTKYASTAQIIDIRLIGITNWLMPSEMARAGHLYTFDVEQNATFPSNLTIGNLYARSNNTYDLGSNSSQFRYAYVGWVGSKAGNTFSIGANNGTAITINTSNNVSLSGSLSTKGAITIDSNTIGGADHLVFNRGSYNYIRATASGGCFAFVVNGVAVASANTAFLIASNGNVSIGQSSGTTKFSVLGSQRLESSVSGAGSDVYLELWRGSNASFKLLNAGGILKLQSNYTTAKTSYFDVMQWNYNTGNVIVNKGNLGIGTTSPSYKLDVSGDARVIGTLYADRLSSATAEYGGLVDFYATQRSNGWSIGSLADGGFSYLHSTDSHATDRTHIHFDRTFVGYEQRVFHNLHTAYTKTGITVTPLGGGSYKLEGTATAATQVTIGIVKGMTSGHKYMWIVQPTNTSSTYYWGSQWGIIISHASYNSTNCIQGTKIISATATSTDWINININVTSGYTFGNNVIIRPMMFDMTQMFGSGNEPTTYLGFLNKMGINSVANANSLPIGCANYGSDIDGATILYGGLVLNGQLITASPKDGFTVDGRFTSKGIAYFNSSSYFKASPTVEFDYDSSKECCITFNYNSKSVFVGINRGGANRGIYDNTTSSWIIYATSANHTVLARGNVGIGATNPSSKLHVTHSNSSATTPSLLVDNTYAATGSVTSAFFKASALANGGIVRVAVGRDLSTRNTGFFEYVYNTTNTKSLFRFGLWGLPNPAIAIDGNSHIGIVAAPNGDYGINMGDNTLKVGNIQDIGGMGLSIGDVTGGMPGIYSETYLELGSNSGIVISTNRKIYLCSEESDILSTTPYIEFDSTNNAFHFSHGIYSDSFISAEGLNAGGSGGSTDTAIFGSDATSSAIELGNVIADSFPWISTYSRPLHFDSDLFLAMAGTQGYRRIYFSSRECYQDDYDETDFSYLEYNENSDNFNFNKSCYTSSDVRLKENVESLEFRGALSPKVYTWKGKNIKQIGFIAQDVQALYPELVSQSKEGYLSLNYDGITAVLSAQINALQEEINEIKKQLKNS